MNFPSPLSEEQLALLSNDPRDIAAMNSKVEALLAMMKTRGWEIFSAMVQHNELAALHAMMKPGVTGEQLLVAKAEYTATHAMRVWPAESAKGILDYMKQLADEKRAASEAAVSDRYVPGDFQGF